MFYTTIKKAFNQYAAETKSQAEAALKEKEMKEITSSSEMLSPVLISDELKLIYETESKHFPKTRVINFLVTLTLLFATQMCIGSKYQKEELVSPTIKVIMVIVFVVYTLASTFFNVK